LLFQVSGLKFKLPNFVSLTTKFARFFRKGHKKKQALRALRNPLRALRLNFKPETKIYIFPIRITSAKIPDAVTAAPAPAPLISRG